MIKYAKIINTTTKQCEVGIGTNKQFYESIGFELLDVDLAYNGFWYLKDNVPLKTLTEAKISKKAELISTRDEYFSNSPLYNTEIKRCNAKIGYGEYTEQELADRKAAYSIYINALIVVYNAVNTKIKEATTVEQVNNITINFN